MLRFVRNTSIFLPFLGAALLLLTATACSGGGGSPTAPESARLSVVTAAVSVDGTVYNDGTYHSQGTDRQSTRFEARLMLDGVPAPGERTWVGYGRGMMNGRFPLYDDGTHGDPVAGDGLYCLEDFDGQYGFHHDNAPHGDYHYDFWGEHHDGSQSNHWNVTVHVLE
jgi:hypothetical protein